ncbi:protein kinase (GMGC family) [Leishmania donovani]|nr:protein kinase (GMGC family) [Leishmania donovani]
MKSSGILQTHEPANVFPFEVCNLLLGKGGSGQVFLGRVGGSDKYVAIKKQYSRYNSNGSTGSRMLPKSSGLPQSSQRTRSHLSQDTLVSSLGSHFVCRGESGLQQLEAGDCVPVSQRRELDLGEESVSQTAALSQQHENCSAENSSGDATRQRVVPPVMDEVSVLNYLGPHPQIVRFLGSYTTSKNTSFFTMELMDSDVGRELREGNATLHEEGVCAAIAYSVLLALEEMHSHAVAHRDVKPGNILLKRLTEPEEWACIYLPRDDFRARLLPKSSAVSAFDPTLCTSKEASSHEVAPAIRSANDNASYVKAALGDFSAAHSTRCADNVAFFDTRGTLHYKSPEQLMGKRSVVSENFAAVDLWGLGCTLYEMVTGTRPFPGSSELQVLMSILDALGSDIQSFPVATKHAALFDEIPASPAFVNLLQRLLCLDPTRRCTAKEALRHSFLASIRDSALRCADAERQISTDRLPYVIGIPLTLKYASFTHIPELRFSRISRTPLKATESTPSELSAPQQPPANGCPAPPSASDTEIAALTVVAEREAAAETRSKHRDVNHWSDGATTTLWGREGDCEDQEEKETPSKKPPQQHCSDTTGTSFLSESSYLHWSEIRPATRPSAPPLLKPLQHKENRVRSSSGCRAVAFFGNAAVGSTPSPSTSANDPQQQPPSLSGSMHRTVDVASRNTVSRALNISDSSVKGVRNERSASHVDFDLSPVAATQLFSTETDTSACLVPHPAAAFLPRRTQPVLQLASGSTFTASNLRANSSFERENLMVGRCGGNGTSTSAAVGVAGPTGVIHAGRCSTPRQHHGQRPTAFSGRALCFSEETDPFTRRSWGSSAGQQSCLNSLLTSPAPVGQRAVEECSPQPSPIRPIGVATRSPSGLPVAADRSGLFLDDSGVGLGWIGMPPTTSAAQESIGAGACEAVAALMPALARDVSRGSEAGAAVAPMLYPVRLQPSWNASSTTATGIVQPSNSPCVRRCVHLLEPPPGGCSRSRTCSAVALTMGVTTAAVAERPDASCSSQQQQPTTSPASTGRRDASSSRIMPLPIPLSVATVCQSATQSLCAPTPRSRTPTSRALHETPRTQRFSCPTSALRTGYAGHKNGNQRGSSQPQDALTSCVDGGDDILSAAPFLCNQDVNASVTHLAHKVCASVGLTGSGSGAAPTLRCAAASPLGSLVACTHSSQRHCTPSSSDPAPEIAVSINCDGCNHPAVANEASPTPNVTVVRASRAMLSTGGPHTPLPVHGSASPLSQPCDAPLLQLSSASLDSHRRSVKDHESDRIETPQSKRRESMKRAREEAMDSEDVAAVRQSARVV